MFLATYEMGSIISLTEYLDAWRSNGIEIELKLTDSNGAFIGTIEADDDGIGGYALKINEGG
jgi:hypothetical protein